MKCESRIVYGGIHVTCIRYFHQLVEGFSVKDVIYSNYYIQLHGSINAVIFWRNDHWFVHDPESGKLVGQFSNGIVTKEDTDTTNIHLIYNNKGCGDSFNSPRKNTLDMYYTCRIKW